MFYCFCRPMSQPLSCTDLSPVRFLKKILVHPTTVLDRGPTVHCLYHFILQQPYSAEIRLYYSKRHTIKHVVLFILPSTLRFHVRNLKVIQYCSQFENLITWPNIHVTSPPPLWTVSVIEGNCLQISDHNNFNV